MGGPGKSQARQALPQNLCGGANVMLTGIIVIVLIAVIFWLTIRARARAVAATGQEPPPEWIRVERASGSPASPIVTVSYECPYCTHTESQGHAVGCPVIVHHVERRGEEYAR